MIIAWFNEGLFNLCLTPKNLVISHFLWEISVRINVTEVHFTSILLRKK